MKREIDVAVHFLTAVYGQDLIAAAKLYDAREKGDEKVIMDALKAVKDFVQDLIDGIQKGDNPEKSCEDSQGKEKEP